MLRTVSASIPLLLVAAGSWAVGCGGGGDSSTTTSSSSSSGGGAGPLTVVDIMSELPRSCAFQCSGPCPEPATPFDCPTVKPWDTLPHDAACGAWDGTYPK